jgi:glycosyltransferase involved in cell wall biosynthesis
MSRSTISVVIPVKDDADHLRRCLLALSEQTFAPLEVIVVDNGSTDDSADVALSFGARVLREDRSGIPAASAAGYDAASADIIARLDADCVAPTDWLARIAETLDWGPTVAAVTGGGHFTDGPRVWRHLGARLYLGSYFILVGSALGQTPLFGSNCAFRRSEWMRVGAEVHRFDPMVHDDIDLSMHLGTRATIRFDRNLKMGISSRPLSATPAEMRIRFYRGVHSLAIHWPQESPLRRHVRRAGRLWRKRLASLLT